MRFVDSDDQPINETETTYVNPKDMIGHLLLVWPIRYETDVPTKYPRKNDRGEILPADAVFCDIVDLSLPGDDGERGKVMRQCRWTQGRLIRDTKKWVGTPDPLLVSMGKDGDAYVIVFQEKNPAAIELADKWESRNPGFAPGENAPVTRTDNGTLPGDKDPWAVQEPDTGTSAAMNRLRRQAGVLPAPPQDEEVPF